MRNCLFAREESDLRGGAAGRRRRRRARPPGCGRRCWRKQAGSRHRRPGLPAADPADVGDRRLTAALGVRSARRRATRRTAPSGAGSPRVSRKPREVLAVLVAGRPGLAPLRRVQLGVVPGQHPGRVGAGSPWPSRPARSVSVLTAAASVRDEAAARRGAMPGSHGGSRPASRSLRPHPGRPPAATGRDAQHRVLHDSVSRQPWVPSMARRSLGEVRVGHLLDPLPAAVGEHHGHVGQRPAARTISTQRSQPSVSTASDEADGPDAHRDQVAAGPGSTSSRTPRRAPVIW